MSPMEDQRKYKRFPSQLNARYLEENKEEWKDCRIINVSREGMGVEVYMQEAINIGSILQMELREDPKFNFVGGIKLITIDSEDKWELLDCVYEDWSKEEEK